MKLVSPFPLSSISQKFGDNANPLYSGEGLKGHPAIDFGVPYGAAIRAAVDGPVAWVLNKGNADLSKYRAVGQIVDGGDGFLYEVSYGHCAEIYVSAGDYVHQGDVIAHVGNTGDVYSGSHYVTLAEKRAGSHAGAHLHFQVRKCVESKTSKAPKGQRLVTDDTGAYTLSNGHFVMTADNLNGYNSCINPAPFLVEQPIVPVLPPNTLVSYEEAVNNLKKAGLTGLALSMATWVLKVKYGRG